MPDLKNLIRDRRARLAIAAGICALALGFVWWRRHSYHPENPLLTTPRIALETLAAKSLYYNGPARVWLLSQRPELLIEDDRDPRSERSQGLAQAVANTGLFRQLDRRYRFDTVFLVGDPSQYRTLLDHLVETKDFAIAYMDHTSIVFHRPAPAAWSLKELNAVRSQLGVLSKREQADFLALTAGKLTAAHRESEAKVLLDEALALTADSAEAWSAMANYRVNRGEFASALQAADRALRLDEEHLGALSVRTQVLYATKRYNEAYALSQRLVALLPDNPNVLFKHGQIAHEAHAYKSEIAVLEKLIVLAESERRSTTGYRLYLAQAHMAAGQGKPAIENFNRVLADPELPADQRKFSEESVARIKSRTGL